MKTHIKIVGTLLLLLAVCAPLSTVRAVTTAFTYQGRLNESNAPASGSYDIAFTLYATNVTGSGVAGPVLNTNVIVTNGLFTTTVDFGPGIFTGTNYWLELAVSTNGANAFSVLAPRQALTPTPYATFAEGADAAGLSGTISAANVGGTYGNPVNFSNGQNSFDGTFSGLFFGTSFVGGNFVGNGSALQGMWHTVGDFGTTPQQNFLGTADNQPLMIKVNGQQAFEFQPAAISPNLLGGGAGNSIGGSNSYGVTISGGGGLIYPNSIIGTNNVSYATIAGGAVNRILGSNVFHSVISGGSFNTIAADDVIQATIAGGTGNLIQSSDATIGGGQQNSISNNATWAVIGGGSYNIIATNDGSAVIAGGYQNSILGTSYDSVVGGGYNNTVEASSTESVIAGGYQNTIGTNNFVGVIGGGYNNTIGASSSESVIAGGYQNTIQSNAYGSFIATGEDNQIQTYATFSSIGGGFNNVIEGDSNYWATFYGVADLIAGGAVNQIQANSPYTVIAGGVLNVVSTNSGWAAIGGGAVNVVGTNSTYTTIAGGEYNSILANANNATIGGGMSNQVSGFSGTVPGGTANLAGGLNSFAAGTQAQATNDGAFVLTDDIATNFYSTTSNQLSARFTGGVRVVTGGAGMTVDGQPVVSGTSVNATTLGGIPSTGFWKTTGNAGTSPGANFIGTSDSQPLLIKAPFVGVGRTTQISGNEYFGVEAPVGSNVFGGMYIDTANVNAQPFYGYSQGHAATAYHYVDGADANKWKLITVGAGVCLTATQTGLVGIGTTTPDALLSVNGLADKPGGGSWLTFSDARLKDVGTNFTHGLEALENIQPVNYHYKKDNALNLPSQPEYVGVVAQQVQAAIPEAVQPNGSGYLTVNNDPIIWTMVNAIKELNHKVDEKDAENAELKRQLAELEGQVRELARERQK